MFLVVYYDYDDCGINSVWFDKELAQERADELNVRDKNSSSYWDVDDIELGDIDNYHKYYK